MALPKGLKYKIDLLANNKAAASLNKFKKDIGGVNSVVGELRNALIAAFSITEITQAANVMIGVENRMQAFTGSAEQTAVAMQNMRRIAVESRTDFEAIGMLYSRLAIATEHLGATSRDVADATQMVANTFVIAGSHVQEANNSARQLAQGLASGALRGDELRSVMENNIILTKMLADGLDMTAGQLRTFGHAGKLTAEVVMPILIAGVQETNELIKEMPLTLGQAGVALRNNFQFMIGDIQKSTQGFSGLAEVISFFARNIDAIFIPVMLGAVAAVKSLGMAIAANPLGFLVMGFQAALVAMYIFRDEIAVFIDKTNARFERFGLRLKLFFINVFDFIREKFIDFNNFMARMLEPLSDLFGMETGIKEFIKTDTSEVKKEIDELTDVIVEEFSAALERKNIPSIKEFFFGETEEAISNIGTGFAPLTELETFFTHAQKGFDDFTGSIKSMQEEIQGIFKKTYDNLTKLTFDFLKTGKASFRDFATAIIDELVRIAIQKLFLDSLFASFGSSIDNLKAGRSFFNDASSQIASDLTSSLTDNFDPFGGGLPTNEGGGYTGMGVRAGGVDGRGGFPAILHPNETVIDHTKGQGMGATVNFNISTVDAAGFDELLATRKNMIISMVNQAYNSRGKMGIA